MKKSLKETSKKFPKKSVAGAPLRIQKNSGEIEGGTKEKKKLASWEGVRANKAIKGEKRGKNIYKKAEKERSQGESGNKKETSKKVPGKGKRPSVAARKSALLAKKNQGRA